MPGESLCTFCTFCPYWTHAGMKSLVITDINSFHNWWLLYSRLHCRCYIDGILKWVNHCCSVAVVVFGCSWSCKLIDLLAFILVGLYSCSVKGHNYVKYHSRDLLFFLSLILNSNHSTIWLGFGFWCSFNSSTISITLLNNHQTIELQLNNLISEYYNITITGVSIKFDIQLEKSLCLKRSLEACL